MSNLLKQRHVLLVQHRRWIWFFQNMWKRNSKPSGTLNVFFFRFPWTLHAMSLNAHGSLVKSVKRNLLVIVTILFTPLWIIVLFWKSFCRAERILSRCTYVRLWSFFFFMWDLLARDPRLAPFISYFSSFFTIAVHKETSCVVGYLTVGREQNSSVKQMVNVRTHLCMYYDAQCSPRW